jgi:hypothetical protein
MGRWMNKKRKNNMFAKAVPFVIIILGVICLMTVGTSFSFVIQEGNKTYIKDQTGERWDITQAKSIGFKPERFQYGIGRNAFTPLDDSYLSDDTSLVFQNLRIIGVAEGSQAQAYSIAKLRHHETANSKIGSEEIVVGY